MSKSVSFAALMAAAALSCGTASAEPLFAFLAPPAQTQIAPQAVEPAPADEPDDAKIDPRLRRQMVDYNGKEAAGTIIATNITCHATSDAARAAHSGRFEWISASWLSETPRPVTRATA